MAEQAQTQASETQQTQAESKPVDDGQTVPVEENKGPEDGPEYRSHTNLKPEWERAMYAAIYREGQGVYLKGGRSLKGPYWVSRIYSDGTYQLIDESRMVARDYVRERDLVPV